jgi:hypothetical protein
MLKMSGCPKGALDMNNALIYMRAMEFILIFVVLYLLGWFFLEIAYKVSIARVYRNHEFFMPYIKGGMPYLRLHPLSRDQMLDLFMYRDKWGL